MVKIMFTFQGTGSEAVDSTNIVLFRTKVEDGRVTACGLFYRYDEETAIPSVAPPLTPVDAILAVMDCSLQGLDAIQYQGIAAVRTALEKIDVDLNISESIFSVSFDGEKAKSAVIQGLDSYVAEITTADEIPAERVSAERGVTAVFQLELPNGPSDLDLSDLVRELLAIADNDESDDED